MATSAVTATGSPARPEKAAAAATAWAVDRPGRLPNAVGESSWSTSGPRTVTTARPTVRSATVGMLIRRVPPAGLGMSRRRSGPGRYTPVATARESAPTRPPSAARSRSSGPTPSSPGARPPYRATDSAAAYRTAGLPM